MALIEREAAIALIEQKQKELCPVGKFSRHAVYGTDRDRFDAWDEIVDQIDGLPTIDPICAAGGCRCGECSFGRKPHAEDMQDGYVYCQEQSKYMSADDFCSGGEPREAKDDG